MSLIFVTKFQITNRGKLLYLVAQTILQQANCQKLCRVTKP